MADIFISYKSEDRARASLIAQGLQAEGFDVWYDHSLQTGQDYQEVIDRELRTALVVVVLWSRLSVKSRWVRSEATIGDRNGALAPAMVETCDLPTAFVLVQTADLSNWTGDRTDASWRAYAADIAAKIARRRAHAVSGAAVAQPEVELVFWQSVKDSTDASDFQSYIKRYPQGQFTSLAQSRLAAMTGTAKGSRKKSGLLPLVAAIAVVAAGGFAAYAFRDALLPQQASTLTASAPTARGPASNGASAETATAAREMDAAWQKAKSENSDGAYEAFLQKYPEGPYADAARAALANSALSKARPQSAAMDAAWADARKANTAEAYERFVKAYPSGPYSDAARAALAGAVPAMPAKTSPGPAATDQSPGLEGVWTIFVSCPSGAKIQEAEVRFSEGRYSRRFGNSGSGGETFLTMSFATPSEVRARGTVLFDKASPLDFEGVASGGGGFFSGSARLNQESNCPFTATRKST